MEYRYPTYHIRYGWRRASLTSLLYCGLVTSYLVMDGCKHVPPQLFCKITSVVKPLMEQYQHLAPKCQSRAPAPELP
ncbi:hypothetical protein Zmor_013205 [Zophobas morio]|uniref:Uncharacterized protein n=1 Tax=Zophobas morio TaxID=2755281 RepID=A0AA38ICS5_9CUCU|nr:hypothetical protein Zmor_013205 [Zophobas morio]